MKIIATSLVAALCLSACATTTSGLDYEPTIFEVDADHPAHGLTTAPLGVAAVEFLDMAFNQANVAEAFETYVGDDYIQHNPMAETGIEPAVTFLSGALATMPDYRYDFKRVLVDGDIVAIHSHVTGLTFPGAENGLAVVDLFRADEAGKFVEHWDVVQPVPAESANDNTMF